MVGGGFSGLTASYYLNKMGCQVELFEKEQRLGGWLKSEESSFGLIECAANGILDTKLSRELFLDLGLSWVFSKKKSEKRYVFRNQTLRSWPLNWRESFRFAVGLLLFFLFKFHFQPRKYESVFHWGKRLFGGGATLWLIAPFLQGIYASDSKHLSASLVLRRLFRKKTWRERIFQKR